MCPLFVYTLFDHRTGKPRFIGVRDGENVIIQELHNSNKRTIHSIFSMRAKFGQLIAKSGHKRPVILSNFKDHLEWFDIPLSPQQYDIYDLHLPIVQQSLDPELTVRAVLDRMATQHYRPYQKLIANASVVYEDLERRGLMINYWHHWPKWHVKTFSGRSSTTGCNIQGWNEPDNIRPVSTSEKNIIIHFDWIAADIRVASLLSGDQQLQESFAKSDPYTVLMKELNSGSTNRITRSESKEYLLKSINSMDYTSTALAGVYPDLGRWIRRCKAKMYEGEGCLESILQRKFRLRDAIARNTAKNPELAVLNGVQQGSVAHAMQATLRRVWELIPHKIIAEIHDCLLISSRPDPSEVKAVIDMVVPIMMRPFEGLLPDNPVFPLQVSIGKHWKAVTPYMIYRESGESRAKKK